MSERGVAGAYPFPVGPGLTRPVQEEEVETSGGSASRPSAWSFVSEPSHLRQFTLVLSLLSLHLGPPPTLGGQGRRGVSMSDSYQEASSATGVGETPSQDSHILGGGWNSSPAVNRPP